MRNRLFAGAQSTACVLCSLLFLSASLTAGTRQPGYPVPHIQGPTVPQAVAPGGPDCTLTVYGANFIPGSTVNWNRQPRTTTYISAHELQATILASDIATPTAGMITVTTTSPNGPITSSSYFQVEVHEPQATMHPRTVYTGLYPFPGGVADFNNDGFLDLAEGAALDFLNKGNGSFRPGGVLTNEQYPFEIGGWFGDFNGDGNVDYMYLRNDNTVTGPTPLVVSFGNGDGTFTHGPSFGLFGDQFGPLIPDVVVGDFNQDGVLDAAIFYTGRPAEIYLGNGDGTFTLGPFFHIGEIGFSFVGDFNGDGKLDLIGYSYNHNATQLNFVLLLGNGDGTFQSPQIIATTPYNPYVFVGTTFFLNDFNNDGKLDIAFSTIYGQVGILLGNGDGTFKPPVYYKVGSEWDFLFAVGDFNSDGNTDILVEQNGTSAGLSILLGNGDGRFQNPQKVSAGETGYFINVGDFNNDGLLDFTIYNSVFLQQP